MIGLILLATTPAKAESLSALYDQAAVLEKDGFYAEAAEAYEKVLAVQAKGEEAHLARLKLSSLYLRLYRLQEGVEKAREVVEQDPKNFDAFFHLANSYAAMKRYPEAAEAFKKTAQIRPDEGLGLMGQALAMFADNKLDEAVDVVLKAKDLFKKKRNIPWHRNARIMVNQMNNFEKYPDSFADLWLENNFKLIAETYQKAIFND